MDFPAFKASKALLVGAAALACYTSPQGAFGQSEIDRLLATPHQTSWAYFRDPTLSKWFISNASGTTYALGLNNSYHSAWVALANQGSVASLDFANKKIALSWSIASLTPSYYYLAISLVGGEASQYVYGNEAYQWANMIAGQSLPMDWYFFQVSSTGTWYIVRIPGTDSTILRLALNSSYSDYDWKQPIDGLGKSVNTAGWSKEFFQESGVWKVRFRTQAVSLPSPIPGSPLTVVKEGAFFDPNYNNGLPDSRDWRQHLGTDFKAPAYTNVVAISAGTVVSCSTTLNNPFNSAVIVQQADGVQVVYGHIKSALAMNPSTGNCGTVVANQSLGYVQPTNGSSTNYVPHVHMGYNTKSQALYVRLPNGDEWGWGRAPFKTTRSEAEARGWVDINSFFHAPQEQ